MILAVVSLQAYHPNTLQISVWRYYVLMSFYRDKYIHIFSVYLINLLSYVNSNKYMKLNTTCNNANKWSENQSERTAITGYGCKVSIVKNKRLSEIDNEVPNVN